MSVEKVGYFFLIQLSLDHILDNKLAGVLDLVNDFFQSFWLQDDVRFYYRHCVGLIDLLGVKKLLISHE